MESFVYVNIEANKSSPVYHRLESIDRVISNFANERILFHNGEIELTAYEHELTICSKAYLPSGELITTRQIVKNLMPGYNPLLALENAKKGIIQRVTNLEMRAREKNLIHQVKNHVGIDSVFATKKETPEMLDFEDKTFDSKRIVEDFLNARSVA
jgi:hypothetical protein